MRERRIRMFLCYYLQPSTFKFEFQFTFLKRSSVTFRTDTNTQHLSKFDIFRHHVSLPGEIHRNESVFISFHDYYRQRIYFNCIIVLSHIFFIPGRQNSHEVRFRQHNLRVGVLQMRTSTHMVVNHQ